MYWFNNDIYQKCLSIQYTKCFVYLLTADDFLKLVLHLNVFQNRTFQTFVIRDIFKIIV